MTGGRLITRNCEHCSRTFETRPIDVSRGKGRFSARSEASGGWVRIDECNDASFPDDGVPVLCWSPQRETFVSWVDDDDGCGCWVADDGPVHEDEKPTHWRALPGAPHE